MNYSVSEYKRIEKNVKEYRKESQMYHKKGINVLYQQENKQKIPRIW